MTTSRFSLTEDLKQESATFRSDRNDDDGPGFTGSSLAGDRLSLSSAALKPDISCCNGSSVGDIAKSGEQGDVPIDPKLLAMLRTIELLTGRKIHVAAFHGQQSNSDVVMEIGALPSQSSLQDRERVGLGLTYHAENSHTEVETVIFSAKGEVATADGEKINVSFDMSMMRHFEQHESLTIRAGDDRFVDPLVINLNGHGAQLGDFRLAFDLDGDGEEGEIPFLSPGSGFLVWDRNEDGLINSGKELFGPSSGHGFQELALFDMDGNGWLDENDPLFDELQIWMSDQTGKLNLRSLNEMGIGALLLTPIDTSFLLTDATNSPLGRIRQTSLALLENQTVATIQEIDLVV